MNLRDTQFFPDTENTPETASSAVAVEPAEFIDHNLDLGQGLPYVRDDRGVRLAREDED